MIYTLLFIIWYAITGYSIVKILSAFADSLPKVRDLDSEKIQIGHWFRWILFFIWPVAFPFMVYFELKIEQEIRDMTNYP